MLDTQNMTKLIRRLSWFAASFLLLIAATVAGRYLLQDRALRELETARELARTARNAAALATDREASIRGYLLTRNEVLLLRDSIADAQLPVLIERLDAGLAGDRDQHARLRVAREALSRWDREFAAPAKTGRFTPTRAGLVDKPLFDIVRSRFAALTAGVDAEFARHASRVRRIEIAGAAALLAELLVFLGAMLYLIRGRLIGQAQDLERQQELLEQQAVELEVQMQEVESANVALTQSLAETERKDHELRASLKRHEETSAFLESALRTAPIGFAFWDRNLKFMKANRTLASAHNREPEAFVGKTVAEVAPTNDRLVQPILEEVLRTGKVIPNVEITRPANGAASARQLRVTFYPITDAQGETIAVGAVVDDVTDAREREERIARSDERYRYVARVTNDVVYEWDIATNCFEWSEGMRDLFGYAPEDIQSSPDWITGLVHPEDAQRVTDTFFDAFKSGSHRWQQPYRLRKKDGKYASVEGRAYILRGADGTPTKVIGAITDRSQQQSLEEQLRQSQKMDAVGRLAGGVAHDFNNILTVMRMSSEFLLEDLPEASESRHEATEIMRACDRASALTRQLLAFSRHQVLNPRVIVLNEVVAGIQGMVKRVVPENIAVSTALDPALHPIKADTGQIEQVIVNLVINAVDAMPNGGRLEIRTANVDVDSAFSAAHLDVAPGAYVCLTVSDSGHGMDKATVTRIFEPFFTTKPVGKGTGLGLATVHGIVTQSGGKIWVYSEPGMGTTFKIFIPRTHGAARVLTPRSLKRLAPATETVLLVEDEASTREAVERSLVRAGYRVLLATNGVEALKIVESNRGSIDLLLTDSMMPEMGGLELISRLRASLPDLRVLMMSGYTEQTTASRFGISEHPFIEKPFSSADLMAAMQRVLHADRVNPAA